MIAGSGEMPQPVFACFGVSVPRCRFASDGIFDRCQFAGFSFLKPLAHISLHTSPIPHALYTF